MNPVIKPVKPSSLQCVLACGLLNSLALAVTFSLSTFFDVSFNHAALMGSVFVLASIIPFSKAQQAHAAEMAS